MKKRIICMIIILIMAIGFMPTVTFAANTTEFAGGSGTESDPYLISTKAHLNNVRNYLSAYFKLTSDIEFEDADFAEGGDFYNGGTGFTPIGTNSDTAFTGIFDGNGFAVKNIYINISSSSDANAGLFGYNNGTVKNLGIVDGTVSISSSSENKSTSAGGIASKNNGTIINCYNTGDVSASSTFAYAGGIAGYNSGEIANSHNTGDVLISVTFSYSYVYAGGIAGDNYEGTITNCYNTGDVSATAPVAYVGGIAGMNANTTIARCYNTGTVTASSSYNKACAGGIVGYEFSGKTEKCYNMGAIEALSEASSTSYSSSYAYAGGIAGYNYYNSTISNCYHLSDSSILGYVYAESISSSEDSTDYAYAGGIAGSNDYSAVTECYVIGSADFSTKTDVYWGAGIVGDNSLGKIANCYYTDNEAGVGSGDDTATKCTIDEMKLKATYVGFDFENNWTMTGNECYPYAKLKNVTHNPGHFFENACDSTCNCGYTREASHNWSDFLYNDDATTSADGTKTRTCSVCGESETIVVIGSKLPEGWEDDPTYRPYEHLPFVTLNDDGNAVVLDHNKSWATRVYWGCIGDTQVEYKWFDEDFRLLCGTDYFADYSPKAGETYNFTKPGWYRFVVKGIRTGTTVEDYTYSELVFDFYYDGKVAPTVPTITELGNNQVKINTNGTAIKKFYYGNIGDTNVPYSWFNSFWGTALGTKTYTPVFDTRDERIITLQTKGYYNIIIVDTNNNEYIYTVYADGTAPVIKKADGESKAIVDIDILKGNVGTKATMTKLYYGYLGTEDKEISTWADFTANVPKRVAASNVAQGTTYNLSNKGYYKFYAVMALSNGRTIEVVYTIDNN